jgi:hypothetical protein
MFFCMGMKLESLILKEHIILLSVFKNRMLKVFGSKRQKVAGGWRKLQNEELRDLYSPQILFR